MSSKFDMYKIRGTLVFEEPMSRHCSWRTGGSAERFFEPADIDDLIAYLEQVESSEGITWIGLGSNVLIRDGGLRGTVISTAKTLNGFEWIDPLRLNVECGTPCAKVAKEAAKMELGGGGFLSGIPGTIGGALAMNAGAFGREIWMLVESFEMLGRDGAIDRYDRSQIAASYRQVDVPVDHWFVSAILHFDAKCAAHGDNEIRELLGRRGASQPTGTASCGSVFKNPPGDFAGRLIDEAGLKGTRAGGCYVSNKHANFIINDGGASAADIEALIVDVQHSVEKRFGVKLEPEVRIIGNSLPHQNVTG
jgi:UDP-N-acetylmuramate dehydrogenase